MQDTFLSQIAFKGLFARSLLTFGETTPYTNTNCAGKERGIREQKTLSVIGRFLRSLMYISFCMSFEENDLQLERIL